jgi:hypothetical protein
MSLSNSRIRGANSSCYDKLHEPQRRYPQDTRVNRKFGRRPFRITRIDQGGPDIYDTGISNGMDAPAFDGMNLCQRGIVKLPLNQQERRG